MKKMIIQKQIYALVACVLTVCMVMACSTADEAAMAEPESVMNSESSDDTISSNDTSSSNDTISAADSISGNDTISGDYIAADGQRAEPVKVKGIYVTGPTAGTSKMDDLIDLVEDTELNALVIDIKNDEGFVTYKMQSEQVLKIDAGRAYIPNIEELVAKCKAKDIYLIARIVAFKDPHLAEKRPELSVRTPEGEIFRDKNGLAWVNPYQKEVWDYLMEIASEAAAVGFDEVQFDYIRFSTDLKTDKLDFGEEAKEKDRIEIITDFTQYAYETLRPLGVYVSADVYGTVIDNRVDQKIVGQDYRQMASHLDYICPMIYPSHYGPGSYGISVPDAKPYDTILAALKASKAVLKPEDMTEVSENDTKTETAAEEQATQNAMMPQADTEGYAVVRPWLQSFTAKWVNGHIRYDAKAIRAQIDAVYDAGYEEWILWNAAVNYQPDSLLSAEDAAETEETAETEAAAEAEVKATEEIAGMETETGRQAENEP